MKLTWAAAIIVAFTAMACNRGPRPVVRSVGAREYLTAQAFTGVFIPDNGSKTEKVDLYFGCHPGDRPDGGSYQMTIGKQHLEGEWNIHKGFGHIWIDKVNGVKPVNPEGTKQLQTPMEFYFRLPVRVDDPWIGKPSPNEDAKTFDGVLQLRNVDNARFAKCPTVPAKALQGRLSALTNRNRRRRTGI